MRKIALAALVVAGLAMTTPAHATDGPSEASAVGILGCTMTLANSVGNRPFPGTPYQVISYATATTFDGVNYVFCVVI